MKKTKTALAIILALVLALSLATVAFAKDSTGEITFNAKTGVGDPIIDPDDPDPTKPDPDIDDTDWDDFVDGFNPLGIDFGTQDAPVFTPKEYDAADALGMIVAPESPEWSVLVDIGQFTYGANIPTLASAKITLTPIDASKKTLLQDSLGADIGGASQREVEIYANTTDTADKILAAGVPGIIGFEWAAHMDAEAGTGVYGTAPQATLTWTYQTVA